MRIYDTENPHHITTKPNVTNTSVGMDFSRLFNNQEFNQATLFNLDSQSQKIGTLSVPNDNLSSNRLTTPDTNHLKIGVLSEKNTTVAHLLLANPELKKKTWSIIHDPVNQDKQFQKIPAGSQIYYNQKNNELYWQTQAQNLASTSSTNDITSSKKQAIIPPPSATNTASQKIVLGTINSDSPTVSNLLAEHKDFKSQRWNIIHSPLNNQKPFTQIPNGATIYIDNETREISWSAKKKTEHSDQARILAKRLDEAVKPFMGTEYKDLDCYTLVVHGLKNMGVRYSGQGGLSRQLLQMAHAEGRADNAYFTGEGITEAMGEKIYTKAITPVKDIDQQSQNIYQEMQHLMKKGDILSFSLESKGHTGVISHNQDKWTFINSGRLDNSINQDAPKNGVGEETLLDEISNWIKLARKRKESLQITVGRLDNQKLA